MEEKPLVRRHNLSPSERELFSRRFTFLYEPEFPISREVKMPPGFQQNHVPKFGKDA